MPRGRLPGRARHIGVQEEPPPSPRRQWWGAKELGWWCGGADRHPLLLELISAPGPPVQPWTRTSSSCWTLTTTATCSSAWRTAPAPSTAWSARAWVRGWAAGGAGSRRGGGARGPRVPSGDGRSVGDGARDRPAGEAQVGRRPVARVTIPPRILQPSLRGCVIVSPNKPSDTKTSFSCGVLKTNVR